MADYIYSLGFVTNIGPWQILMIVFIVLLLFGAKRLPELFKGLGQGIKEFKKATRDIEDDIRSSFDDEEEKKKSVEKRETPVSAQSTKGAGSESHS